YDLLTGKPPFKGKSVVETLQLVCTEKPRPPIEVNPTIPHDLQIICLKCLEKDPGNRYRSARALAEDLRAFLDGAPITARSYSEWEGASLWMRRRPTAAALLLVSVLALVGVAVGGVLLARQQSEIAKQEKKLKEEAEKREKDEAEHAQKEAGLRKTAENERN